jgi:Flp pilus assembly protein CpaB
MAAGRRKGGVVIIILAVLLIVILAAAFLLLRNQIFPPPKAEAVPTPIPVLDTVKIAILAQPVSRGSEITEGVLLFVEYPRKDLTEGLFYTEDMKDQLKNKRAKYDLGQGTPLTPSIITDAPPGSYASVLIPRGMVAISIPITRLTSVSYALQSGDHVNIIGSLLLVDLDTEFQTILPNYTASVIVPGPPSAEGGGATATTTILSGGQPSAQGRTILDTTLNQALYVVPSEVQRPRLVSQTLLQDAVVLWVGDFPEGELVPGPALTPTPLPEGAAPPPVELPPDIITLIVSPQDAVTLNYLMLSGAQLNLVLRGTGDDQRVPTEAVTLQFLLDQYGIPYPAKLPYGMEPRKDDLTYPPLLNGQ